MTSFANNRYLNDGSSVDHSMNINSSKKNYGPMSASKMAMAAKRAVKVQVKDPLRSSSIERSQNNTLRKSHSSFGKSQTSFANNTKLYTQDSVHVPAYYSRPGPGNYFDNHAGTGENTIISKYVNAPSGYIQ